MHLRTTRGELHSIECVFCHREPDKLLRLFGDKCITVYRCQECQVEEAGGRLWNLRHSGPDYLGRYLRRVVKPCIQRHISS